MFGGGGLLVLELNIDPCLKRIDVDTEPILDAAAKVEAGLHATASMLHNADRLLTASCVGRSPQLMQVAYGKKADRFTAGWRRLQFSLELLAAVVAEEEEQSGEDECQVAHFGIHLKEAWVTGARSPLKYVTKNYL
jgi:hypothetical protein